MTKHLLLAVLASCPFATAQALFHSPAPYAHHEGNTSTGYPIGYQTFTKMSYQQVHGGLPSLATPFKRLAFRPRSTSALHAAYTANVTLQLGVGGPAPDSATSTYASNMGPSPVTVLNQATVNIAAMTQNGIAPGPYNYAFPFPTPFVYDGSGVLAWDLRVHSHTYVGSTLSFDLFQLLTTVQVKTGGRGCTASGKAAPATLTGSYVAPNLSVTGSNLNDNLPTALLAGLSSTKLGPITLPLDLTAAGAPCALRTDIVLTLPGTVSGGTVNWQGSLGATAPDGTALFLQVLSLDPTANSLGVVLTNGLGVIWPYVKRPVIRNWTTNNDAALTGNLQLIYGLVCEFGV
jgi:hypothetical protein